MHLATTFTYILQMHNPDTNSKPVRLPHFYLPCGAPLCSVHHENRSVKSQKPLSAHCITCSVIDFPRWKVWLPLDRGYRVCLAVAHNTLMSLSPILLHFFSANTSRRGGDPPCLKSDQVVSGIMFGAKTPIGVTRVGQKKLFDLEINFVGQIDLYFYNIYIVDFF